MREAELEWAYEQLAQTWDVDQFLADIETYWKTGKGAAKIRWGTAGDWTRCYRHLSKPDKPLGPERAKRICAQWHKDMTGVWPGSKLNK